MSPTWCLPLLCDTFPNTFPAGTLPPSPPLSLNTDAPNNSGKKTRLDVESVFFPPSVFSFFSLLFLVSRIVRRILFSLMTNTLIYEYLLFLTSLLVLLLSFRLLIAWASYLLASTCPGSHQLLNLWCTEVECAKYRQMKLILYRHWGVQLFRVLPFLGILLEKCFYLFFYIYSTLTPVSRLIIY